MHISHPDAGLALYPGKQIMDEFRKTNEQVVTELSERQKVVHRLQDQICTVVMLISACVIAAIIWIKKLALGFQQSQAQSNEEIAAAKTTWNLSGKNSSSELLYQE